MSKLIIVGDIDNLKAIAKRSRLQAKKYGLSIELIEDSESEPANKKEKKLTAVQVVDLISQAEKIEDLEQFKSDYTLTRWIMWVIVWDTRPPTFMMRWRILISK